VDCSNSIHYLLELVMVHTRAYGMRRNCSKCYSSKLINIGIPVDTYTHCLAMKDYQISQMGCSASSEFEVFRIAELDLIVAINLNSNIDVSCCSWDGQGWDVINRWLAVICSEFGSKLVIMHPVRQLFVHARCRSSGYYYHPEIAIHLLPFGCTAYI
jgi:hypothetical protein